MHRTALILFLFLGCTLLHAQSEQPAVESVSHGAYGALSVSASHDSANGFSNQLTPAAGYDMNSTFTVEAGAPFYTLSGSNVASSTSTQSTSSSTAVWGDLYGMATGNFDKKKLRYKLSLKGTLPTGDTASGISTGNATWNWNNHFEVGNRVALYLEAGLGNTLADTMKYHRSYTTYGYVAPFASGLTFDLGHTVSLDLSTYYDLPFGDQKLYSRIIGRNVSLPAGSRLRGRLSGTQFFSQGGASLTEDHGYSAGLSFQPVKHLSVSVNYNRSIPDALDAVSASLSFRFGHMAEGSQSKQ